MMTKVNFLCQTSGKGFWSAESKDTHITGVGLGFSNEEETFGELRARFTKDSWDVDTDGLIYTDPMWIREFRSKLQEAFHLTDAAVADIEYSEQGMQGDNYVSMDIGKDFLDEWSW